MIPFRLIPYGEPTIEPSGQRYLFGGKEREHAGGRNSYDFGARCLTPYGRWGVVDRYAEKFYPFSPYNYCSGDPINYIDPDGNFNLPGALIGGGIDAIMQISDNMDKGYSFWDAVCKVDVVSVLASAFVGATLIPGASVAIKVSCAAATVANASIDISITEVSSVGGIIGNEKHPVKVLTSALGTIGPQLVSNAEISAITKSTVLDLSKSVLSTMTKAEAAQAKQIAAILSSSATTTTINVLNSATGAGTTVAINRIIDDNKNIEEPSAINVNSIPILFIPDKTILQNVVSTNIKKD